MSASIGYFPGDPPVRGSGRWYKPWSVDLSGEHVKILASEVAPHYLALGIGTDPSHLSGHADANGFICAADFDPGDWPTTRKLIRDLGTNVLKEGPESLVKSQLAVREARFAAEAARLDAAASSSFSAFHALSAERFQPATDAAQQILGLAEALQAKGHVPPELIAGVQAAYAKAEQTVGATAAKLKAAAAKVSEGFEARGVEMSVFSKAKRDVVIDLLKSASGRFKICRDKDLRTELPAEKVFDHYQGYGELYIGESPSDPHLATITSLGQLMAWCNRWIGPTE